MAISKNDIIQKRFSQARKGYDCYEVDLFLDSIAKEVEQMGEDMTAQKKELDRYVEMRDSIVSSILSAQQTADKTRAEAEQSAERIIADANAAAEGIIAEARAEAVRIMSKADGYEVQKRREIDALRQFIGQLEDYIEDYKSAIESEIDAQLGQLQDMFRMPEPPVSDDPFVTGGADDTYGDSAGDGADSGEAKPKDARGKLEGTQAERLAELAGGTAKADDGAPPFDLKDVYKSEGDVKEMLREML